MNRILLNVGVCLSTALGVGAIVSACAHNDSSLVLRQVLAPITPNMGTCAYTSDPTQASMSGGFLDLAFGGTAYAPAVIAANQILSQSNQNALQTETSDIVIHGAQTRITDLAGNTSLINMFSEMCQNGSSSGDPIACQTGKELAAGKLATPINPFSTVESTFVPPGSGQTPGYAVVSVTLVDGATLDILRQYFFNALQAGSPLAYTTVFQLLTYTKLEGTTLGGDSEESNEYEFPVSVGYGELVENKSSDAMGLCLDTTQKPPSTAQTCVDGQDVAVIVKSFGGLRSCQFSDGGAG